MIVSVLMKMRVMRQKVFLTALGIVARGLGVSDAARPTSSVPAKPADVS